MQRALVALSLASTLGACVAENGDEGIIILKNVSPAPNCVLMSSESELFISHGTLDSDPRYVSGYEVFPQMRSRITAVLGDESKRTIITRGANVELSFPYNDPGLPDGFTRYRSLFTAPISPNDGLTDGAFTLIPLDIAREIAKTAGTGQIEILATFRVDGTMSGEEVTSQAFSFPITMGPGAVNVPGPCPLAITEAQVINNGNSCNPQQDGQVTCCTQSNGALLCPATTSM